MVETAGIIPEVIVVDATVDGVSKFRDKMRISLTIPAFKSDYPTNCTDFPEGMDTAVKVDESHRLELRRQSLVKRQGGGTGDGSKPFHYYWGINKRSEEPVTVFAEASTHTSSSQPSGNGLRNDPAGISIERQVAYKGAIELGVARIQAGETVTMETILEETEKAANTIHGGPVVQEAPEAHADEEPHETSQEAFDNLGPSPASVSKIGNLGDFMTKAMQEGHGVSSVVLKKLGVAKPVDILPKYETFDAAWKVLATP